MRIGGNGEVEVPASGITLGSMLRIYNVQDAYSVVPPIVSVVRRSVRETVPIEVGFSIGVYTGASFTPTPCAFLAPGSLTHLDVVAM